MALVGIATWRRDHAVIAAAAVALIVDVSAFWVLDWVPATTFFSLSYLRWVLWPAGMMTWLALGWGSFRLLNTALVASGRPRPNEVQRSRVLTVGTAVVVVASFVRCLSAGSSTGRWDGTGPLNWQDEAPIANRLVKLLDDQHVSKARLRLEAPGMIDVAVAAANEPRVHGWHPTTVSGYLHLGSFMMLSRVIASLRCGRSACGGRWRGPSHRGDHLPASRRSRQALQRLPGARLRGGLDAGDGGRVVVLTASCSRPHNRWLEALEPERRIELLTCSLRGSPALSAVLTCGNAEVTQLNSPLSGPAADRPTATSTDDRATRGTALPPPLCSVTDLVLALAAAAPLLAVLTGLWSWGWSPSGDDALIVLRSFDVLSRHGPLVGQVNLATGGQPVFDPGPLQNWVLAIPSRLFPDIGPAMGALVFDAGRVVAAVLAVAWSVGRSAALVVAHRGVGGLVVDASHAGGPRLERSQPVRALRRAGRVRLGCRGRRPGVVAARGVPRQLQRPVAPGLRARLARHRRGQPSAGPLGDAGGGGPARRRTK